MLYLDKKVCASYFTLYAFMSCCCVYLNCSAHLYIVKEVDDMIDLIYDFQF